MRQFQEEEDKDHTFEFNRIVEHKMRKQNLMLKTEYLTSGSQQNIIEIPFRILKKNVPLKLVKDIENYVINSQRKDTVYHVEKVHNTCRVLITNKVVADQLNHTTW